MDVKHYFRKIREVESSFLDTYPVVVSLETSDGGKAGLVSETSRPVAAKLIVEGRAVLANDEQKELFYKEQVAAKRAAEKAEVARRVQLAIIAEPELQSQIIARTGNQGVAGK